MVATVGNRVFVLGGAVARPSGQGIANYDAVEAYDTLTRTWHTLATMPEPVASAHVAVLDDRYIRLRPVCTCTHCGMLRLLRPAVVLLCSIFVLGGHQRRAVGSAVDTSDGAWRYDVAIDAWACLHRLPLPSGGGAAIVAGGVLYSALGAGSNGTTGLVLAMDASVAKMASVKCTAPSVASLPINRK